MAEKIMLNFDEERLRIYRIEVLNNVGYILATLVISHGLYSFDFFQELVGLGRLFGPMVMGIMVCLLAYLVLRLLDLTRDPRMFFVSRSRRR
ncbi:MAG: hypothetical protein ACETVY_03065 [Candidatus Bathyarchaeia archaeon]